jgi:hypothetical protein
MPWPLFFDKEHQYDGMKIVRDKRIGDAVFEMLH